MVRRRYGRIRLLVWMIAWAWLLWNMGALPFVALGSWRVGWDHYIIAMVSTSAIILGLLLPLLLLSFFHPFYRERFLAFLNVAQATSAPASSSAGVPAVLPAQSVGP